MKCAWLILLPYLFVCVHCDNWLAERLIVMLVDVLKDTNTRIGHLSDIKQECQWRPGFEIGYLMFTIQDKYRRMVDKYHMTAFMEKRFFLGEFVLPLEEVELHYWEIEHILNMMHEIERKYQVKGLNYCYTLTDLETKILNEVSWPLKLKLLKDYDSTTKQSAYRRVGIQAYKMETILRDDEFEVDFTTPGEKNIETNMKMKLFRLMYETIRDSDVKVKRAEVIKKYYTNSTTFNLGYVMGEITERFNVMTDIALTMKRLYAEWKPMEHINAYEQIANKAVELSNMVDVARSMLKRDSNQEKRRF